MNIIVVEFDSSGGLIHYAYQLCTALKETGAEITLITGTDYELKQFPHNFRFENTLQLWPRHSNPQSVRENATIIRKFSHKLTRLFRRGTRAIKLIQAWISLTNHLIRLKPDIVQFSEIHFFFESFFLMRLKHHGITLSQICHEFEHREEKGALQPLITQLNRLIFPNFSTIFFLSRDIRDSFIKTYSYSLSSTHLISHGNESIFLKNAALMECGENLREKYNLESFENVILFFGTLVPSKGVNDLIEAFALLPISCKAKLVIAGFPSKHIDPEMFKKQAASHQLLDKTIFDLRYIPTESIGKLMDLATIVVFPYHSSTQSGAIQVAYTFGRPVIATAVGGLTEVVEDGRTGYLVPPNRPDLIAQKIIQMLGAPETTKEMGVHAKHLAETRFSWQPIASTIREAYDQLLKSNETHQNG